MLPTHRTSNVEGVAAAEGRWRQRFKRATGVESVRFLLVVVVDSIKRVGLMGRHVAGDVGMGCKPGISRALYVFNEILEDPYA